MKTHLLPLWVIVAVLFQVVTATSADADKEEFRKLILQIVTDRELQQYLPHRSDPLIQETPIDPAKGREAIAKMKVTVPKLLKLIKVGTSVFDYPGLIAYGTISWNGTAPEIPGLEGLQNSYFLTLGVPLGHEGNNPSELEVHFDAKGIITDARNVDLKR